MAGRWTRCLAGLVAAAVLPTSTGYAPNPPRCATDITGLIVSFSEAAKRITWASDYCMLGWDSGFGVGIDETAVPNQLWGYPSACSLEASGAIKAFIKAAKFMSMAAFVCGNVDTGCAQQVLAVMTNVAAIAQYTSEAVFFCPKSRLWCVGNVCDVAVSIALMAQNIQTGLELCSGIDYVPPAPPGFDDGAPEPEPGAPEPQPGAPEPEPDQPGATPAPFGDNLQSSFFPGMTLGPAERRLRAAVNASLDTKVLEEARRRREELSGAMERFRLQVKQGLRRAAFEHAVKGKTLPEPLQSLEARIENATAQAKADAASVSAEGIAERMEELLAKLKDFETAAEPAARAPVVV